MWHRLFLGTHLLDHRAISSSSCSSCELERRSVPRGRWCLHQHNLHLFATRSIHWQGELLIVLALRLTKVEKV